MTADAYTHLPALRGRLTPPDKSQLRATPDVLATWDRRARMMGRPANWRLSDRELDESRRAILGEPGRPQDLWVYAYGSLMWDPGIHFAEVRLAELEGYRRRFTYKVQLGRGTAERPGLMLSLEPGAGCCKGLAFRVAAHMADGESEILWRREMLRGGYSPAMLPMTTPQGNVTALVLTSNRAHPDHVGELSLGETAAFIATASGFIGTNRDYLEQLALQLQALEIEDVYIEQLHERVQDVCNSANRKSELAPAQPPQLSNP